VHVGEILDTVPSPPTFYLPHANFTRRHAPEHRPPDHAPPDHALPKREPRAADHGTVSRRRWKYGTTRRRSGNRMPPAMEQRALPASPPPPSVSCRRHPCYPCYWRIRPPRSTGTPHPKSSTLAKTRALGSRPSGRKLDGAGRLRINGRRRQEPMTPLTLLLPRCTARWPNFPDNLSAKSAEKNAHTLNLDVVHAWVVFVQAAVALAVSLCTATTY
jgi:hypothetical protein